MQIILEKLCQQIQHPKEIVFADFDGTVFTAGIQILQAPFYNQQTAQILKQHSIPLIIVTGRPNWKQKAEIETRLLGMPLPDAVITGAGTIIYIRDKKGRLIEDKTWDAIMQQSLVVWKNNQKEVWKREKILTALKHDSVLTKLTFTILPPTKDKYLIRLNVKSFPVAQLHILILSIENLFVSGIKVVCTEKLLQPNTTQIFSGDILILPATAGKENATTYMLHQIVNNISLPEEKRLKTEVGKLHAFCFGDASIDIDFLTLQNTDTYSFSSYGVHMTPLAKKLLEEKMKTHGNLHVVNTHGPQTILHILKESLSTKSSYYSAAQNDWLRNIEQPFELLLDNIIDKKKSPNDISFLGLAMVKQSIDMLYDTPHPHLGTKIQALQQYMRGNAIDLLDGIRARQQQRHYDQQIGGKTIPPETHLFYNQVIPGQLVDGFCDRIKEFYHLYRRSQKRFTLTTQLPDEGYRTLLAAISCVLPSIARAQAELAGIIVPEHDEKGGSAFDRTRNLFQSLFFETIGKTKKSFQIDQKIYTANMATFENRLNSIPFDERIKGWTKHSANLTSFQQKALERFLLYIQLLQEEHTLLQAYVCKYYFEELYQKEFEPKIAEYLAINIHEIREKHGFKEYPLTLSSYLSE